jgi:hypothetical protein
MVLWALPWLPEDERLRVEAQSLARQLLQVAEQHLSVPLQGDESFFAPVDLTAIVRAAGELRIPLTERFVELVGERATVALPSFPPPALVSLLHGLVSAGGVEPESRETMAALFDSASPKLSAHVTSMSTRHLSLLARAYATLGVEDTPLLNDLAAEVAVRCRDALRDGQEARADPTSRAILPNAAATIAWAYAVLGHHDADLMDALTSAALPRIESASTLDLSMLAWAFATLSTPAPDLFAALRNQLTARLSSELDVEVLANTLFSLAAAGELTLELAAVVRPALSSQVRFSRTSQPAESRASTPDCISNKWDNSYPRRRFVDDMLYQFVRYYLHKEYDFHVKLLHRPPLSLTMSLLVACSWRTYRC